MSEGHGLLSLTRGLEGRAKGQQLSSEVMDPEFCAVEGFVNHVPLHED